MAISNENILAISSYTGILKAQAVKLKNNNSYPCSMFQRSSIVLHGLICDSS